MQGASYDLLYFGCWFQSKMKLRVLKTYVQTAKPLMQIILILILIIENGKGCVNYYNIIIYLSDKNSPCERIQ